MAVLRRFLSGLQGAFWLVRGTGLRGRVDTLEQQLGQIDRLLQREEVASTPLPGRSAGRNGSLPPLDLRNFEEKVYSQNGEDGILKEIFRRIGTTNRYFVEFGAQSGQEGNCARLAWQERWQGLFLEADPGFFATLREHYRAFPDIHCVESRITSANIEELFAAHGVPASFDLLSIDIDGNDYWVWEALRNWRPRVVVIEYNASHPPPQRWVMQEDPDYWWNGTSYFGASLASLTALARRKGYALVGTDSNGVNAFFVLAELAAGDDFLDPALHYFYSPPTYGAHGGGHPPGAGPFLEI